MLKLKHPARVLFGKIRRLFTVHFRTGYVARQLRVRQGDCHQCGTCCHFTLTCPLLTRANLCLVYGKCRPKACRVFPIDQKDIDDVAACGGACGYFFDAARERLSVFPAGQGKRREAPCSQRVH